MKTNPKALIAALEVVRETMTPWLTAGGRLPVPQGPKTKELKSAQGKGGAKHKIKIGDKMYTYNGTGDTADLKNYTEVPK
jgi:hypothetical protein